MKCLCGLNQKPENIKTLEKHINDCTSTGFLKNSKKMYHIVWKDQEFQVKEEVEQGELKFESTTEIPGIFLVNEDLDTSENNKNVLEAKEEKKTPAKRATKSTATKTAKTEKKPATKTSTKKKS